MMYVMGFRKLFVDLLSGRAKHWRTQHNPVVTDLLNRVRSLPYPLQTINRDLLFASIHTVHHLFAIENEQPNWITDPKEITTNQLRKIYTALMTYFVFVFTIQGTSDDIAAGSRELLDFITEERSTIVTVTEILERLCETDGKPDAEKMSIAIYDVIRDILDVESDVVQLMTFGVFLAHILPSAFQEIRQQLKLDESERAL